MLVEQQPCQKKILNVLFHNRLLSQYRVLIETAEKKEKFRVGSLVLIAT